MNANGWATEVLYQYNLPLPAPDSDPWPFLANDMAEPLQSLREGATVAEVTLCEWAGCLPFASALTLRVVGEDLTMQVTIHYDDPRDVEEAARDLGSLLTTTASLLGKRARTVCVKTLSDP